MWLCQPNRDFFFQRNERIFIIKRFSSPSLGITQWEKLKVELSWLYTKKRFGCDSPSTGTMNSAEREKVICAPESTAYCIHSPLSYHKKYIGISQGNNIFTLVCTFLTNEMKYKNQISSKKFVQEIIAAWFFSFCKQRAMLFVVSFLTLLHSFLELSGCSKNIYRAFDFRFMKGKLKRSNAGCQEYRKQIKYLARYKF